MRVCVWGNNYQQIEIKQYIILFVVSNVDDAAENNCMLEEELEKIGKLIQNVILNFDNTLRTDQEISRLFR